MIDEHVANLAADAFVLATSDRWGRPSTEIQDGGTFVLLSLDTASADPLEIGSRDRLNIEAALSRFMPVYPEQPLGTWMVVFKTRGEVYESILPRRL